MAGWHHLLDRHEFEPTLGVGEGQGSLACYSPWGSQRVRHNLVTEQQQPLDGCTFFSFLANGFGGTPNIRITSLKSSRVSYFTFSQGKAREMLPRCV